MCSLEIFKLDMRRIAEGQSTLTFHLDDDFFQALDAPEVSRGSVDVALDILRRGDLFTLDFHTEGTVVIPCDLCLDDMEQPVASDNRLLARFGNDDSNDNEELVTIAEDEGILDISWLIYEFVALSIPVKHVHAPGKCNDAMTQKLEELSAARSSDEEEPVTDPRWEALSKLKIKD